MKRFLRKAALWLARISAVLVVLLILFYAEEDWRGARDWAACQRDLAAKGESLDLRQLASPGKPEDDLSKVPIFAELYEENAEYQKGTHPIRKPRIRNIDVYLDPSPPYSKSAGKLTDLESWQKYYRSVPGASHVTDLSGTPAKDVVKALSQFDSELYEIDTAVSNPNAYWPIDYKHSSGGFIGGTGAFFSIVKVIQLRAVARLDNQETDLAEKDYLFTFRLGQPLTKGCFLINYFILADIRNYSDAILSEGLRRHSWDDAQLHEMESALASTDMLALAVDGLRMSRASLLGWMKNLQDGDPDTLKVARTSEDPVFLIFIPRLGFVRPVDGTRNEAFIVEVFSLTLKVSIRAVANCCPRHSPIVSLTSIGRFPVISARGA